jgi:hypothetical protein
MSSFTATPADIRGSTGKKLGGSTGDLKGSLVTKVGSNAATRLEDFRGGSTGDLKLSAMLKPGPGAVS